MSKYEVQMQQRLYFIFPLTLPHLYPIILAMIQNVNLLEKKLNFYSKTTRQNKKNMYTTPPPNFLEIYGTSTASHAENKCSTYHRYASALFSPNSLYLNRLFPKKIITKGKQHNFFTNNQLSHKTRKKIFRFIYQNVLFGLGQFNPKQNKLNP